MTDFTVNLGNKQRIIIEMNQRQDGSIFDKNDLYAFSVIVELSHKNRKKYPKVILINIDNFNRFKTDKPILTYELIHLVLANMNNPKYNIDKEIKKFARFLKERDLEKLAKEEVRKETAKKLLALDVEIEKIAISTGLSRKKLEDLQNEIS